VAALRAGRDDKVTRFLRLPLPEPYVPTRLESARDRLRARQAKAASKAASKPKPKPKSEPARKPPKDAKRRTAHGGDDSVRRSGHHGGRQRQPSRRARPLEGQRYG
jgi:cell division protein FtsW